MAVSDQVPSGLGEYAQCAFAFGTVYPSNDLARLVGSSLMMARAPIVIPLLQTQFQLPSTEDHHWYAEPAPVGASKTFKP